MFHKVCRRALWVSTIAVLLITALQGLSGHWVLFFFVLPGGPDFGRAFIQAMVALSAYHRIMGFAIGAISILTVFFALFSESSIYVRIFAIVGFVMVVLAATGGILYVTSAYQDRWSLGQMADAFVGVLGAYFLQLFFMNKTPRFPWNRAKAD